MTDKKKRIKKDGTPFASSTGGPGHRNVDQTNWRTKMRTERVKFDDDRKAIFLKEFATHGRFTHAATAAGVSYWTVKTHVDNDEEFAEAMEECKVSYRDRVIERGQTLIFDGIEEPIIGGEFRDEVVAHKTIIFPNLVAMEMRKVDPDYKERQEIDHKGTGGGVLVAPAGMTAEAWIAEQEAKNKTKEAKPGDLGKPGSK